MLWSSNDVTQQGSRPKTKLDIMRVAVTIEISNQLSEVLSVIERHLESTLLAVHLYGSAVDGGLKPYSDIDLLVTVAVNLMKRRGEHCSMTLWRLRLSLARARRSAL
jgi:streptomycin 3"-adenylyltransferase